jgi:hypothetical protein
MKDHSKAALDRMGILNNALVELIDGSELTPSQVLQVLELHVYRLNRVFEVKVTPRRLPARDKGGK